MENKSLVELYGSPQYMELQNFVEFSKWFECEIFDVIINLLQWCDDKVHWTIEVVSLWDKISWWAKFLKFF
jgi:hypothetical protein